MDADALKARTKAFALRAIRLCEALPKNYIGEVIGKQVLRSATSGGANYRAACRARSQAKFSAKLQIISEEADESNFWLELIEERGLLPPERLSDLRKGASAIFVSSRKTVTRNMRTKR